MFGQNGMIQLAFVPFEELDFETASEHMVHSAFIRCAVGASPGGTDMMNASDRFDAVGIVVDWIDACRQRRLDALLDLYDDAATVECCEGGNFSGRSDMERYWRPRLAKAKGDAFAIDALMPEGDGVSLDYRDYDGRPMRTHFRFTQAGKIRLTACEPIKQAA